MIIKGATVDKEVATIEKSISNNLKNKKLFQSEKQDTATQGVELKPPIPMRDCLYVFENSSHVAKCCRILASDIIYNEITLTPTTEEPSEKLTNNITAIKEMLDENIDEVYNIAVDYYYAGWCAMEYVWDNTRFSLKHLPIHTCSIIRTPVQGLDDEVYLLKQKINSTTRYFKIMGEQYPDNFVNYQNQPLSNVSLIGGDNIYAFFSLPRWVQNYKKILTEIAIASSDYRTVSNGNISSGVLNINLEPQQAVPLTYDDQGNPVPQESRQEAITKEITGASGGTAVIFTESNRPVTLDYVGLTNNNQSYLSELGLQCQQAVLNDYNIPLVRLMINTDKESMNSDKTKSIWEIYTLNLQNEQRIFKIFIAELIYDLYSLPVQVDIDTPIFSDRREIEVKILSDAWNDGALTLGQYVTGLSDYLNVIDLNDYDFNRNPEIWSYRKIPEISTDINPDELALLDEIEEQLNAIN